MAKYVSNRQKNLKVGLSSYSENLTSVEVTGKVGIGTTNAQDFSLYVVGDANISGIVSAVAFYGDGSNLYNVLNGIGIRSDTENIGFGVTIFDFIGPGITDINYDPVSGIATINVNGTQGTQGTQGFQGNQGVQGLQGLDGQFAGQGVQGSLSNFQGTQGIQGISGEFVGQGVQGLQGIQGIQGCQGSQGLQGLQGKKGRVEVYQQPSPVGINSEVGDIWTDTDTGITFTYYYDGDGYQWVEFGPEPTGPRGFQGIQGIQGTQGRQGIQGTKILVYQQASPIGINTEVGDVWVNTDTAIKYTYYYDGDSYQWVEFGPEPTGPAGPIAGQANQILYKDPYNNASGSNNFKFENNNVFVAGIVTASSFHGDGSKLTNLPAAVNELDIALFG